MQPWLSSTYVAESKRAWSSHGAKHNLGSASASEQPACFLDQNIGRGCGDLPETLTLFQTKICDFPDAISDPTHSCRVLFRPDSVLKTGGPGGPGGGTLQSARGRLRLEFHDLLTPSLFYTILKRKVSLSSLNKWYSHEVDCKMGVFGRFRKARSSRVKRLSPFSLAVFTLATALSFEYWPSLAVEKNTTVLQPSHEVPLIETS